MKTTINSRKLDRTLTFSAPGGGYIYVDLNGKEGTLGNQICRGGRLTGDTLSCDGTQSDLDRKCVVWYKAYLRANEDLA